ncbi:hypothetical protein [Teichococcus aestuarii]|uniref:hypothetical protein n=1 Tax=Teichococcus aestuarii TaxID=568898 RepID=UPI003610FC8C
MARIRSIHPGLFTDEAFVSVSHAARLFVIGLWTEADDQGVFAWKVLTLKMRILPADACDAAELLEELRNAGMLMRYEVDGKSFGAIRNFRRFQRPEKPKAVHPITDEVARYVDLPSNSHTCSEKPLPPMGGDDGDGDMAATARRASQKASPDGRLPVGDRSPTSRRLSGPMEEEGGRGGDSVPSLRSGTPPAAPAVPEAGRDVREEIDTEGLELLKRLTGKPHRSAKALLGKFVQAARDDCALVLGVLEEALEEPRRDAVSWIFRAIDARMKRAKEGSSGLNAAEEPMPLIRDDDGLLPQQRERVERYVQVVRAGVSAEHQERLRMEGFMRAHDLPAWQVAQRLLGAQMAAAA